MENKLELKQQLYLECEQFCNNRLKNVQKIIDELQDSLISETKSSAGDKHETGRAMLQIEREKAGNQLAEIQKLKEILFKIDVSKSSKTVCLGSLVITSSSNYFIAISSGELVIENQKYFAISPNTPIAKLLFGKSLGDAVIFNGAIFTITEVV